MVLMIIAILIVVGLVLGSFVNALVWRLRQQELAESQKSKAKSPKPKADKGRLQRLSAFSFRPSTKNRYSILAGRSMCPNCKHELAAKDLIPVLSWLSLRGKCRYCQKPISVQYPLVELGTAAVFAASYWFWPSALVRGTIHCPMPTLFHGATLGSNVLFVLWLVLLTGFMALVVYDLRWYLLPDRIVYPLGAVAGLFALLTAAVNDRPLTTLLNAALAIVIGGGIFYLLFQLSNGKWIGGGDVKLGWLLGAVVGTPAKALLFIFIASLLGSFVSVPLLMSKRLKRSSIVPFGPFLIIGAVLTVLFGTDILHWYRQTFINF